MYFGLEETFGFTKPLKEGNITYKVNDMEVTKRSLYVPGVGWCPMTDNLCKDFKNDPTWMALYCSCLFCVKFVQKRKFFRAF